MGAKSQKNSGRPKLKMSEAAREAYNAALREWRRKNRDKVRECNIRYWEKKAQQLKLMEGNAVTQRGNEVTPEGNTCEICNTQIDENKKYCSKACKQKAYRMNQAKGI